MRQYAGASFEGGWGAIAPKGKRKKEKREKRKKKERKKGTTNNVKLLHIKCCFFQFFNSPVALKNKKNVGPQEKVEMTPLPVCSLCEMNHLTNRRRW